MTPPAMMRYQLKLRLPRKGAIIVFLAFRPAVSYIYRKLPALSTNLVVPTPIDNPALHQGRIRTTPHVDGNWAAHVYVSISITTSHALYSLLDAVIAEARQSVPTLHSFISSQSGRKHHAELHISLSRPIFIRAYQTEELRRAVRKLAQHPP